MKTVACMRAAEVPPRVPAIAGMSPLYVVRQLNDMKTGTRGGTSAALMQATVVNLTEEDIVALAAYLASLDP